jgi:hypothetical protein
MIGMSGRARWAVAGTAGAVVLGAAAVLLIGRDAPSAPPAVPVAASVTVSPTSSLPVSSSVPVAATTSVPSMPSVPSPAKPASGRPRSPGKAAMPAPTPHPVDIPVPPPPHPAPVPGCAPSYAGENAPKAEVRAALLAAAGKDYWAKTSNPPLVAVDPPTDPEQFGPRAVITVPPTLIEAIAWQESGWQSAIRACDGGVGTMQLMAPTATWMNQRFGTSYDHTTLAGNVALGAQYLEWLIAYFGENNFGHHYDITDPDLITAVLVGYNAGPGAVRFSGGHTVASSYATTVKALMVQQPWGA